MFEYCCHYLSINTKKIFIVLLCSFLLCRSSPNINFALGHSPEPTSETYPVIDPDYYTVNVRSGEKRSYNITRFIKLQSNGTYIREGKINVLEFDQVKEGQTLVVKVTKSSNEIIQYEISIQFDNNTLLTGPKSTIYRSNGMKNDFRFITTTNQTLIEQWVEKDSNTQYNITSDFFSIKFSNKFNTYEYAFDLRTGWLNQLHYQHLNTTHLIEEYQIIAFEKSGSFFSPSFSYLEILVFGVVLLIFILLKGKRHKNRILKT
ncbi:MAG: hypothetical protein JSW11_06720 [Candidatus Heimdallarchaeota archaeon]|nr:MAG: hypothetical protein JSW11_06720 [Candidatus Heimdallarchaeota archaeon]